jgi:heme-degrading monooxygenase HmoA
VFAPFRKASGEQCLFVSRNSKNPNDLLVWCEWDTTARMKKFATSPELRAAMKDAGVTSKPVISFYSKLENLSAA